MEIPQSKRAQSFQNLQALQSALEQAQEDQADELVLDFDQALEEHRQKHKNLKVRLGGRVFELPPSPPFSFIVFFQRHAFKRVGGKEVYAPEDAPAIEMITHIFGEEMLAFLESRDDLDLKFVLERVVPGITDAWGLGGEGKEGKPT